METERGNPRGIERVREVEQEREAEKIERQRGRE